MKTIILALSFMFSSLAFAELPPPGKARKGQIKVKPVGMEEHTYDLKNQKVINRADSRRVQKKLDDLRKQVAELKQENAALRERAERPQSPHSPRVAEVVTQAKREDAGNKVSARPRNNRVSIVAGIAPDALSNRRKDSQDGNSIELKHGPVLGGQYQRLVTERISIGGQALFPTRTQEKKGTYLGTLGFDF